MAPPPGHQEMDLPTPLRPTAAQHRDRRADRAPRDENHRPSLRSQGHRAEQRPPTPRCRGEQRLDQLRVAPGQHLQRCVGVIAVLVEVVAQGLGAGGVAQLGHCFGFDLSDALSGDPVDVADFIERAWSAVDEPESQPHNVGLSRG
jgi:hypothetical protein